ncbi:WS/DGAT/MGAT family O-acyltransferase [Mycobacteroides franklinii]|uniref:Diacylglycerol O-acyltransferase n=1 Tax=Mycobacteroides franklinii TaxID=948102 RepID=A0A4R8RDX7_9MYCO|nr:wax ester/triacylglycerol synthase family O-acyltransferase [Mycobacteroides franklinii]TDZ42471.1 putative diacylglycerol O-acyltransferase [Mycobacteroides franklinii]TDZ52619.1 putative diacylglycerol O-acyltransferase [Mycobacteroides franklinii]TDZ56026.1 putative diacylglycerol O-acyltransferase [Mycobacteroides franklinii]TDZ62967.1 putative diacylglycerol O-acyltransferase [Mycobacteroides franklinii]TDZ69364.1 putative diacylglycerol O-acyltransferase [Mycobacteroides franklinii]
MQRLSGLDASFLYLETPTQPMHVCGILELDTTTIPGGYSFEKLRTKLAERVEGIPSFKEKLADSRLNLDHPVWVDDDDFDIDRHLHHVGLPSPGGKAEIADMCGHIASLPLDRARPLWEMWVIETGATGGGTRLVVMTKMHHASVDGVTGANLMSTLCALEPDAEAPEPTPGVGGANSIEIAVTGALKWASRPLKFAKLLPATIGVIPAWLERSKRGEAMSAPFSAPRTSFNSTITSRRNVGYAQLDLEDVRAVKNHFGVKVNDVVMAICAGALRKYLDDRGELPDNSLVAMVPVSVHEKSDRPGRNQVSGMFSRLETNVDDPVTRLQAIAAANNIAKDHTAVLGATLLQDWSQFAAPAVFGTAMRVYSRIRLADRHPVIHNLVVSNVPGPQVPLYFLGAQVIGMYPLGPIFHGAALTVTVMSLDGKLNVGLISCPDLMPDLFTLTDDFGVALQELKDRI